MPIKESSDELNPAVVTSGVRIARPRGRRTAPDLLALAVATCGVGYVPLAPGTFGSGVGVGLYLLLRSAGYSVSDFASARGWGLDFLVYARTTLMLLAVAGLAIFGVWAATRAEKLLGRKDPGAVVIDEVVGQLIAFIALPAGAGWPAVLAGFVLFRLFDIWKPYPVRRLEALESGLGIMADDVLAGAYAAVLLSAFVSVQLLW